MKRGSIVLLGGYGRDGPLSLLPTFRFDCEYRPAFLNIYLDQLRAWEFPVRDEHFHGPLRRYSGDLVELGKGEILDLAE